MSPTIEFESPPLSVLELLLLKYPDRKFGMTVFIEMTDYKKWQIERALQARKAKPNRRFKNRRG